LKLRELIRGTAQRLSRAKLHYGHGTDNPRNEAAFLIGARVVQGVGSALMNPATLSIITATFPPKQRGTAIGIWVGVSAMALAIGPLVGGLITDHIHWSWIFFINVPVGIAAIVVARLVIDESRDTSHEQRPDLPGPLGAGLLVAGHVGETAAGGQASAGHKVGGPQQFERQHAHGSDACRQSPLGNHRDRGQTKCDVGQPQKVFRAIGQGVGDRDRRRRDAVGEL